MSDFRFFDLDAVGDVTVLRPHLRSSDLREINEFQDTLLDYLSEAKPARLVVDFAQVTRTSSWFIGTMIRLERRVKSYGGQARLCNMNRVVREVFHLTALDRKGFRICESLGDALADLNADAAGDVAGERRIQAAS